VKATARNGARAKRRPTIDDVARHAGVSKGAVSLALNGRPGVSDATRLRVAAAADALGWRPSARAKALSESRALAIGLIIARPPSQLASDPFFAQLLAGVETEVASAGYALVLSVVGDVATEAQTYRRLADDGRVDGVLITDARLDDPRYALVAELGLEAVVVGHPDRASGLPGVAADERTALAGAVGTLVDLGHECVAHVSGPAMLVHCAERRDAWRDALLAGGLPAGPVVEGDFTAEGGARATKRLLQRRRRPTAILYANDLMAIGGPARRARDGPARAARRLRCGLRRHPGRRARAPLADDDPPGPRGCRRGGREATAPAPARRAGVGAGVARPGACRARLDRSGTGHAQRLRIHTSSDSPA
jgi:DNA-binding LacI/PurR family transcriptional regulator